MSKDLSVEVLEILGNADSDVYREMFADDVDFESEKYWSDEFREFAEALKEAGIKCDSEDHHGGEGQGDDYWTVFKFTRGSEEVYVKFDGWYASYNGSEYDDYFLVKPVPKTGFNYIAIK